VSRAAVEQAVITHDTEVALADERAAKVDARKFVPKLQPQRSTEQLVSSAVIPVALESNAVARAAEAVDESQAAHAAAEQAIMETHEQLAHGRNLHLVALRKIEQLKKRLAMVESNARRMQSVPKGNPLVKAAKGNSQQPSKEKATRVPDDWNLSHGPVFR